VPNSWELFKKSMNFIVKGCLAFMRLSQLKTKDEKETKEDVK